jgi:pyruvate kinase
VERQFSSSQETIAMSAIYAANHFSRVRGIACLTESGTTPLLMSRLSSGLPIFGLSNRPRTLARLSLCRGVIPLYFDADSFAEEDLEGRAIEFLRDGEYLTPGDALILTRGENLGQAGATSILKILAV